MCPLCVLLLWALVCPGTGKGVWDEIFTRPGSDFLLPIRRHLTLNHTESCDGVTWSYWKYTAEIESTLAYWEVIAEHRDCKLSDFRYFSNTRISEDGSLIISNVTLENAGRYNVKMYNSTHSIQVDYYSVHVEGNVPGVQEIFTRPGSDLLLPIRLHLILSHTNTERCDWFYWYYQTSPGNWDRIAGHRNCKLTDDRHFPNTRISEDGSLIISNVTLDNDGRYSVEIFSSRILHIQRDYFIVHVEGKVLSIQEEIFTWPGSDLLLPIRSHLTLNHADTERCDRFYWYYEKSPGTWEIIADHRNCKLSDLRYFPNTRISEDGSLIISTVTLENDRRYNVYIYNPTGSLIQRDYYTVHVEVLVPVLHVSCLQNGSAEISCRVKARTELNIHLSVIGGSQGNYSTSANSITVIVESPGPWTITCTVENGISQSEESRAVVTCPEENWSGIWSGWGHLLTHGVMFVLNTGLLIFIVNDLRKMKNEKNLSERRRDQMEMEMEPAYYNDRN